MPWSCCQPRMAREVSSLPLSLTTRVAPFDDAVELASNADARERVVDDQSQAFPSEVIGHSKHPELPAAGQGVRHEVQRPALVRSLWQRHRRPRSDRPFAPAALANHRKRYSQATA